MGQFTGDTLGDTLGDTFGRANGSWVVPKQSFNSSCEDVSTRPAYSPSFIASTTLSLRLETTVLSSLTPG